MTGNPPKDTRPIWKNPWAQAILLVGLLILYVLTKNMEGLEWLGVFFGICIAISIFAIVALEIREGAKDFGWKHEIIDTAKALLVAVVIWVGIGILLNTSSPISAVASCSMIPNLERGDFVVVQGAPLEAYEITMTQAELQALQGLAQVQYGNETYDVEGSIAAVCSRSGELICQMFKQHPEQFVEYQGPLLIHYGMCTIEQTGEQVPCTTSFEYKGESYPIRESNDILVYTPKRNEIYALIGDIVHRTYVIINVDEEKYYLTKGDNNPIMDIQVYHYGYDKGNGPVSQEQVNGKVIARIPLLGYFKLFVSAIFDPGLFQEDPHCQQQLIYP